MRAEYQPGAFFPTQDGTATRWQNINRALYEDISLPPVVLYKLGRHVLVDGNQHVLVVRQQVRQFIESKNMRKSPGETEGVLHLWVLELQYYLANKMGWPLQFPNEAACDFVEEVEA